MQAAIAGQQASWERPTRRTARTSGPTFDELEARCKNNHGNWQNTSLDDYRKCHGQIVNQDGALRCVAASAGAGGVLGVPGGSYTQSCGNIQVEGDDLKADCASNSGETRSTHLDDYQKCKSDIINDDGHLRCSK